MIVEAQCNNCYVKTRKRNVSLSSLALFNKHLKALRDNNYPSYGSRIVVLITPLTTKELTVYKVSECWI